MLEIELRNMIPRAERDFGESDTLWHTVEHKWPMTREKLAENLKYRWCPVVPQGADGPAISVRFTQ